MRRLLVPAILVATLGATGFAVAKTVDGTIQSLDKVRGHVTLDNGGSYDFAGLANHATVLDNFKVGDTVSINYAMKGEAAAANSISPMSAGHNVVGAIEQINPETGAVTVAGVLLDLSQLPDYKATLGTFKTGDRVAVSFAPIGTGLGGLSISPVTASDNAITAALTDIDHMTGMVTMQGGLRVKFEDALKARLDTFKDGDIVRVTFVHSGTALLGESISPAG